MIDVERRGVLIPFDGSLRACAQVAALSATGQQVVAVHLETGAQGPLDVEDLRKRAKALGASEVVVRDVRLSVYRRCVLPLIHAARAGCAVSPAWVAAEDYGLAAELAAVAREVKAAGLQPPPAWCPEAGARMDATFRALLPELPPTPAEDDPLTSRRLLESAGLMEQALPEPPAGPYRVRARLWGTLTQGRELDAFDEDPEDEAFPHLPPPWESEELPEDFTLELKAGTPSVLSGHDVDGVGLFEQLNRIGRRHSVGRALLHTPHGRVACEAPATTILVEAQQALEACVLDPARRQAKRRVADDYEAGLLAGSFHAPRMRDAEAFFASCLAEVSGRVRLQVAAGNVEVVGVQLGTLSGEGP